MNFLCRCLLFAIFSLNAETVHIVSSEFVPHNGENLPRQGYAIELVKQIFANEQCDIRIEFLPWPRALQQAKNGEAAAIVTLWYDTTRAEYLNYPTPLYNNVMRLYHHNNRPVSFENLTDLTGKRLILGLVRGYSYNPMIVSAPFELVEVFSDLESLKMLALGRVDLVIAEQMVAEYLLKTELSPYNTLISSVGPVLEEKPMYLAFSKAHPDAASLQQKFERGLFKLKQQQGFQALIPDYSQLKTEHVNHSTQRLPLLISHHSNDSRPLVTRDTTPKD